VTTTRTSSARRFLPFGRRAVVALTVGAGVLLTPLPALANSAAPTAAQAAPIAASNQAAQIAINTAMAQRGKPYVWAGAGPSSFDCSGLTQYAFRAAGINLPHSSSAQAGMGTPVSGAALRPGDLVFFHSPISHVGIYIGNGQMVHAPTTGDVVKISNISVMGPLAAARRLA
jgi:cell wall-associated NlpC family hydrolase